MMIYIYIYTERVRERKRQTEREREKGREKNKKQTSFDNTTGEHESVNVERDNKWKKHAPSSGSVSRYYLPTPPLGQDMTQGQFLS